MLSSLTRLTAFSRDVEEAPSEEEVSDLTVFLEATEEEEEEVFAEEDRVVDVDEEEEEEEEEGGNRSAVDSSKSKEMGSFAAAAAGGGEMGAEAAGFEDERGGRKEGVKKDCGLFSVFLELARRALRAISSLSAISRCCFDERLRIVSVLLIESGSWFGDGSDITTSW